MPGSEAGGVVHPHLDHEGTVTSIDIGADESVEKLRAGSWACFSSSSSASRALAALRLHVQLPVRRGRGQRETCAGGVLLRDDRPDHLLGRIRPDGAQAPRRGRHVHLCQPRARPDAGNGVRPLARCGVHALRRVADRRLRRFRPGEGRVCLHMDPINWIGMRSSASSACRRSATSTSRSRPRSSVSSRSPSWSSSSPSRSRLRHATTGLDRPGAPLNAFKASRSALHFHRLLSWSVPAAPNYAESRRTRTTIPIAVIAPACSSRPVHTASSSAAGAR